MGRKSIEGIRKPQILEHFRLVINQEGIHKASVAKVAKSMGVSPNLILHFFGSKEALVIAFFDDLMDHYLELIKSSVNDITPGPDRLDALLKTMFGLDQHPEILIEKPFYAFFYLSLFDNQMKTRFNQKYQQFVDLITSEIGTHAQGRGLDREDWEKQAEFLVAIFEGFWFEANFRTDTKYSSEFGGFFYEKACHLLSCEWEE